MLPPADEAAAPAAELAIAAVPSTTHPLDTERWSVRLELADEEIAKLYGQGMTRGAVVWRKGMVEWRPLLITAELAGLLRRTRTTLTSTPSLPGVEVPTQSAERAPLPPLREPSILPPELAARPVTPITVAPTAFDVPAAPSKPRRSAELVAVAVAAFALAWIGRGKLPGAPRAAAQLDAPAVGAAAPSSCEPQRSVPISSEKAADAGIRTVAVTDLPLAGSAAAATGAAHAADGRHGARQAGSSDGSQPSRAELVAALARVAGSASGCGERGGPVRVVISFAGSGVARSIQVSGADLPSSTRSCIIGAASRARVSAFSGDPVTVSKTL
jgi:hypothetical protein